MDLLTRYYSTLPAGVFHTGGPGREWGNKDHLVDWTLPFFTEFWSTETSDVATLRSRAAQVLDVLVRVVVVLLEIHLCVMM